MELKKIGGTEKIKDTDKISNIIKKIYNNVKRKYVKIGNSKGGKNFRDIVIPEIYLDSPLSKFKSNHFKFDDIQNIYIFIRKLFFIAALKGFVVPVKNLDLSKKIKDYILYRGAGKTNQQFCIFKMSKVRTTDNPPLHIFYKDNGSIIVKPSFDDLKKALIQNLNLEEIPTNRFL